MHLKPLTWRVVSASAHAAAAEAVRQVLQGADETGLAAPVAFCPLEEVDGDVLVPLVHPEDVAASADAIRRVRSQRGGCVIPLAMSLSCDQIASLLKAGACDFLTLPLDASSALVRMRRALGLLPEPLDQAVRNKLSPRLKELVGSSPTFMKPLAMLPTIAGYDAGVLILGETGTGKEVYARAVHYSSARAARPWVALNCGAVPTELLESELFGHVRGAFTHAHAPRAGLVREAEGGTLFLDEIDSLPLASQSKLLRFVQEMEYRPVGADKTCRADVRIIAASNQDLPALAESGAFRRDLYFRLSVLTATLPPLRERREDIDELAQHFIDHFCRRAGRTPLGLSGPALQALLAYQWPGNVRELRHTIERAVLMCKGTMLRAEDLQLNLQADLPEAGESLGEAKARMIAAFETDYIQRLLSASNGNVTHAAQTAGKNRRAFFELMRKHGIDPVRFRALHGSSVN